MTSYITLSYLYSGTNVYKEYYIKDLPPHLQGNLLEDEPRGIEINYEKDYFITCTKCVINYYNYNQVLYHTLYLAFVF